MILNLAQWLNKPVLNGHALLLSAPEDSAPIVNSIIELIAELNGNQVHAQSFNADRYFDCNIVMQVMAGTSLFTEKNLLSVTFKTKPTAIQQKQLASIHELANENNFLIISCEKLDKRELNSQWIKYFIDNAMLCQLTGELQEARTWAKYSLKRNGINIEDSALDLLITLNQNNSTQLNQELNKLGLFFNPGTTINAASVRELLLDNQNYNVYALSEAYLSGNIAETLKIFNNISTTSEELILMLWNLGEDLRKMIKIKNSQKTATNFQSIASSLRIWGNAIAAFNKASQRLTYSQLLDYFNELALIDMSLKGALDANPKLQLKELILRIAHGIN